MQETENNTKIRAATAVSASLAIGVASYGALGHVPPPPLAPNPGDATEFGCNKDEYEAEYNDAKMHNLTHG